MSLSLDLDTEVLDIRDQSEKFAWTDQYPGIEILTGESRFRYENIKYKREKKYNALVNNLTFKKAVDKSADERVMDYMKNTKIFTQKADYFNLKYYEEKKENPLFAILFLIFMGILGLGIALKFRRRANVH